MKNLVSGSFLLPDIYVLKIYLGLVLSESVGTNT